MVSAYRAVALGVLWQALLDARRGDPDAIAFVEGPGGAWWAQLADVPDDRWPPAGWRGRRTRR